MGAGPGFRYVIAFRFKYISPLVRCIGTNEILSKRATFAFWYSSWLAQLYQARSIEHRRAFESKAITYLTQVWWGHVFPHHHPSHAGICGRHAPLPTPLLFALITSTDSISPTSPSRCSFHFLNNPIPSVGSLSWTDL